MSVPGVVGVGEGRLQGVPSIKVMVSKLTEAIAQRIPGEIEGHPVEVEETGEIRAVDG